MPLLYDLPHPGPLRQGEILGDIWEHVPRYPPVESKEGQSFPIDSIRHELVVVMSPDCDLEWDFKARFPDQQLQEQLTSTEDVTVHPSSISHVFLAKAYVKDKIRPLIKGSDIWRRINGNQDERYHHLKEAPIGDPQVDTLPDLYIDFKKALAMPTKSLYEGIRVSGIKRIAVVPDKYVHDLMHRYYGFLSRVALPEP